MPADGRGARGRRAEAAAEACLIAKGLRIIARNWRASADVPEAEIAHGGWAGEIDIVADDGGLCVFVEVRSRTGDDFGHPLEAVTPRKRAQVVRAARQYLAEVNTPASGYRFDVVGVRFDPHDSDGAPECTHVEAAFEVDN